jgi:hypothetical protein
MYSKQVDRLIECLENARTRPAMYFGEVDVGAAMHFLNGVGLAIFVWLGEDHEIRNQVIAARGWHRNAMHPSGEMIERGLTPAQVIDEMLVIEIETIRRLAAI